MTFCTKGSGKGVWDVSVSLAVALLQPRLVAARLFLCRRGGGRGVTAHTEHHCHQESFCVGSFSEAWAASRGAGAAATAQPAPGQPAGSKAPLRAGRDENPKGQSITKAPPRQGCFGAGKLVNAAPNPRGCGGLNPGSGA